jgi:hypothetical protein
MVFRPDRNFPPDYLMEETLSCRVRAVTVRMEQIPAWWVDFRISHILTGFGDNYTEGRQRR